MLLRPAAEPCNNVRQVVDLLTDATDTREIWEVTRMRAGLPADRPPVRQGKHRRGAYPALDRGGTTTRSGRQEDPVHRLSSAARRASSSVSARTRYQILSGRGRSPRGGRAELTFDHLDANSARHRPNRPGNGVRPGHR